MVKVILKQFDNPAEIQHFERAKKGSDGGPTSDPHSYSPTSSSQSSQLVQAAIETV